MTVLINQVKYVCLSNLKLEVKLGYKNIWFLLIALNGIWALAQTNDGLINQESKFTIRGSVIESDTRDPISNVNIEITGGDYTTTDMLGVFNIQARRGDELTIRHIDFETVFYTIQNNDEIKVEVESNANARFEYSKLKKKSQRSDSEGYKSSLDSAQFYLKKDAKKSI